jgi:hypothetical protein
MRLTVKLSIAQLDTYGILPALNIGRVRTPIPQENLGCFLFVSPLTQ